MRELSLLSSVVTMSVCLAASSLHAAESKLPGVANMGDVMNELSNADITWDATFDGFVPHVSERAAAAFRADEETISALLGLLANADKFVVAHVGLTKIAGLKYSTFPTWNGLDIHVEPDGRTTIDPGQRHMLAKHWKDWHESTSDPTSNKGGNN